MTEKMRKCENCEYGKEVTQIGGSRLKCFVNPPTVVPAHTSSTSTGYPEILKDGVCRFWLPKGCYDTPVIKEAWEDFLVIQKLALDNEDG